MRCRIYNAPLWFGVISSAGRASALQAEGRRFDPVITHQSPLFVGVRHNRHIGVVYLER